MKKLKVNIIDGLTLHYLQPAQQLFFD